MKAVIVSINIIILIATNLGPCFAIPSIDDGVSDRGFTEGLYENSEGFPSYFTRNVGQISDEEVLFHSQDVLFTGNGLYLRVLEPTSIPDSAMDFLAGNDVVQRQHIFKMELLNMNNVVPIGLEPLSHKNNFLIGNDPGLWVTGAPNFKKIAYPNVYDGIDLVFSPDPDGLKYEFKLEPGAQVENIRIGYDGAVVSTDGEQIFIRTSLGTIIDGGLLAYQVIDGEVTEVDAHLIVKDNVIRYAVDHDPRYPLVIDPLVYGTYFNGGGTTESLSTSGVDDKGDVYLIGSTRSSNFPTTTGAYQTTNGGYDDICVVKLSYWNSTLEFSTYVGGDFGDYGHAVEIDPNGNALIAGYSSSSDFPTTPGAYQRTPQAGDGIIFKLNSDGTNLLFSSLVGGSDNDFFSDFVTDNDGNIYLTGDTASDDFPTSNNAYQSSCPPYTCVLFVKMNKDVSSLLRATLVSTTMGFSYATGRAITIDANNNFIVAGSTNQRTYPTTPGAFQETMGALTGHDAFVTKVKADATGLIFSTFLGGDLGDHALDIMQDDTGNILIAGRTESSDFPTTNGAYDTTYNQNWDMFLTKMNPTGNSLVFSTFIGGSEDDFTTSMLLDDNNRPHLAGFTYSSDFPTTPGAESSTLKGTTDGVLLRFNSGGTTLLNSTYIGGTGGDNIEAISIDSDNNIVGGMRTSSIDFPVTQDAYCSTKLNTNTYAMFVMSYSVRPGAPLNLKSDSGKGYVGLSWDPPTNDGGSPVRHYSIYRGPTQSDLVLLDTIGDKRTYTDTDVINGDTYYYKVSASNFIGEGPKSNVVSAIAGGVPGPPLNVGVTPGSGWVIVNWDPPSDNGGFDVTGYAIYRGPDQVNLTKLIDVGLVTYYNDSSIINGKIYYYGIRAVNVKGEGDLSNVVKAEPGERPSAPLDLTADGSDGRVALRWSRPLVDGGFNIDEYRIYKRTEQGNPKLLDTCQIPMYEDDQVQNGVIYHYSVSAVNKKGEGPRSTEVDAYPGKVPDPPTLTVLSGDGLVRLTWQEGDNGGFPVQVFNVYRGDSQSSLYLFGNTTSTTFEDMAVINNQTYYYSVSATNLKGEGNRGPAKNGLPTGMGRVPGPPTDLLAEGGDGVVYLSWSLPNDFGGLEITEYMVYKGMNVTIQERLSNVTITTYEDRRVENNVTYFYSVSAVNARGEGVACTPVQATPKGTGRAPGPPIELTAVAGDGQVALSWQEPLDYGGERPFVYKVLRSSGKSLPEPFVDIMGLELLDASVENGVVYYYQVVAVNGIGESGRSNKVRAEPLGPPTKPLNLTVVEGNGHVILGWKTPLEDGGRDINRYLIFRGTKLTELMEVGNQTSSSMKFTDDDVTNGVTYYYAVEAVNQIGHSDLSDVISARPGRAPDPPEGFRLKVNTQEVVVIWEEPVNDGGYEVIMYNVYRGTTKDNMELIGNTTMTKFKDTKVEAGKKYFYKVSAVNDKGEGLNAGIKDAVIPLPMIVTMVPYLGLIAAIVIVVVVMIFILRKRLART